MRTGRTWAGVLVAALAVCAVALWWTKRAPSPEPDPLAPNSADANTPPSATSPTLRGQGASPPAGAPPEPADGTPPVSDTHELLVQVRFAGIDPRPAHVFLKRRSLPEGPVVATAETDEEGTARFAGLPALAWRVLATAEACGREAAIANTPQERGEALEIVFRPEHLLRVRVVDRTHGDPVRDATVEVFERDPGVAGGAPVPYAPHPAIPPTDREGRTTIHGLAQDDALVLRAASPDHDTPRFLWRRDAPGFAVVAPGATDVTIELAEARTVVWPIAAQDPLAPADGTPVEVKLGPGPNAFSPPAPELPPKGVVAHGHVVVEDVPYGTVDALAVAPDGSLARLWAGEEDTIGHETTFRRPRTIKVALRRPDGSPVTGLKVAALYDENRVWHPPVAIDTEGRVSLSDLYWDPWTLLDVVAMDADTEEVMEGWLIGTVDLAQGDGDIEATVLPHRDVILRVRVDGEPVLPPVYLQILFSGLVEHYERDEAKAEIRFRWRPPRLPITVQAMILAGGFLDARTAVDVGDDTAPIEATLDLRSAGSLLGRVLLPPDRVHHPELQAWDPSRQGWVRPAPRSTLDKRGGSEGEVEIRCERLPPGRYRLVDTWSGMASAPVDVRPEVAPPEVLLDLTHSGWVEGRVITPAGSTAIGLRVEVEGLDTILPSLSPHAGNTAGLHDPGGTADKGQRFRVRVPGDRPVDLKACGHALAPHPKDGRMRVTRPRTDVVLRVVAMAAAVVHLDRSFPSPFDPPAPQRIRVHLYRNDPGGEPAHLLDGLLDGDALSFAGWPAGTWTLWFDLPGVAPVVMRDVGLEDADVDLGEAAVEDGAELVLEFLVAEGQAPPRYTVRADALDPPAYFRAASARSAAEIRVRGLGSGRFSWTAEPEGQGGRIVSGTLRSDGKSEIVETIDLR